MCGYRSEAMCRREQGRRLNSSSRASQAQGIAHRRRQHSGDRHFGEVTLNTGNGSITTDACAGATGRGHGRAGSAGPVRRCLGSSTSTPRVWLVVVALSRTAMTDDWDITTGNGSMLSICRDFLSRAERLARTPETAPSETIWMSLPAAAGNQSPHGYRPPRPWASGSFAWRRRHQAEKTVEKINVDANVSLNIEHKAWHVCAREIPRGNTA